ncbi:MAG: hypothetical protein PHX47_04575, partial [Candidatus ainarchaeum sp.]|nr:hypothetical protein [Candidatus ainarchaeum sp.]
YEAKRNNTANDVVAIGYQAGRDNTVANQFIIKQANINAVPLIQGDFASGNVGIGTSSPDASALLQVSSTSKGFLPPVMTGSQAEAISSPATGLMVFASSAGSGDITSAGWWGYNGSNWIQLG